MRISIRAMCSPHSFVILGFAFLTVLFNSRQSLAEELTFEQHIRPILREYCLDCHGATEKKEGSLDLRLARFIVQGGESGPSLVAGDPAGSLLLQRVESGDMPPGEARVSPEKVELLRRWIADGAKVKRAEPDSLGPGIPLTEEERSYWAYQPVQSTHLSMDPTARDTRTPIDILVKQAMPTGLTFSADADRRTLIQRAYADVIGLPPTSEQLLRWSSEQSSDWYEQMVDSLLTLPQYGERWGRHWLDAVGYADSDGSTLADAERSWAWRYRDYVIASLNSDKPFDQFIIEQLAGDELAGPANGDWTPKQIELLTATGFLRMAADGTGSGDNSPEARNKTIADTMQIIGSTLLASSLNCAQCHDHRYDPISHQDYFAVRAVFDPALDWQNWKTPGERLISLSTAAERQAAADLEIEANKIATERNDKQTEYMKQALDQELTKYEEPLKTELRTAYETAADKRSPEQKALLDKHPSVNISPGVLYQYLPKAADELKKYDEQIAAVRAKKPADSFIMALVEPANHLPLTKLFHRGDFNQPTQEVAPSRISVLSSNGTPQPFASDDPLIPTSGRRLAFAQWLTDRQTPNPLFVRAMINRIWLHHFGRGIVSTPGDFGKLGSQPTHPQVLDWLADYWIKTGWSLKKLHRIILTSTVFRQSSVRNDTGDSIDPANIFYWHKPLMRVDAEVLRDSLLALSGDLDLKSFGPPIPIEEDDTGQVKISASQPRRSVYAKWRRTQPVAMLQSFDAPVMQINCDARTSSTVATQSLMLMNNEVVLEQANKIAKRVISQVAQAQATPSPTSKAQTDLRLTELRLPPPPEPMWCYGTGSVSEQTNTVDQFIALKHFTGSQWQGGPALPDSELGWVLLHAQGGHPGNTTKPAIRRWVVPVAGKLKIRGTLGHGSEHGDGVRARIVTASTLAGSWTAKQGSTPTEANLENVDAGQAIDFIVDCITNETSDSFTWPLNLTLHSTDGKLQEFDSTAGFQGPQDDYRLLPQQIVSAWQLILQRNPTQSELDICVEFTRQQLTLLQQEGNRVPSGSTAATQVICSLCQTLLGSNEFLYIE